MIIVGGCYREVCRDPKVDELLGSGVRAAAVLKQAGNNIKLITAASENEKPALGYMLNGMNLCHSVVKRTTPITFYYTSPLTNPSIDGITAKASFDETKARVALVFGMLEAIPSVEAEIIVYDPQRPRGPLPIDRDTLRSDRFAVVANGNEIIHLGGSQSIEIAADNVIDKYQADLVIVKRGAYGAFLKARGDSAGITVPVYPTEKVFPIGSGDVFSAFFAWYWGHENHSSENAAEMASAAAACWCSNPSIATPVDVEKTKANIAPITFDCQKTVKVYLAGPFFGIGERWLVETVRDGLVSLGADVFSPLHDVGLGGDEVAGRDINGLDECDVVLALLDRSDSGTLFEVGYAIAKGTPVVGLSDAPDHDDFKMLRGTGVKIVSDMASAVYNSIWAVKH